MKPLSHCAFLIPRTSGGSTPLSNMLAEEGAEVLEFPEVAIGTPPDPEALDSLLRRVETFDWAVFCHVSAARIFLERLVRLRGALEPLAASCRLAAVGPHRAAPIRAHGLEVNVCPGRASPRETALALAEAAGGLEGVEVLVVSAEPDDPVMERLESAGASVTLAQSASRSLDMGRAGEVTRLLEEGRLSAVVFLHPGGVDQLAKALEAFGGLRAITGLLPAYAMSEKTAERARALGFEEVRAPGQTRRQALFEAILGDFSV